MPVINKIDVAVAAGTKSISDEDFLIMRLMAWSEIEVALGLTKKYPHLFISDIYSSAYFLSIFMTSLFPICIIRSFEPFPYMRIVASWRSTSELFKLHSSEILIPVENNVSHIAMSRRVRFLR